VLQKAEIPPFSLTEGEVMGLDPAGVMASDLEGPSDIDHRRAEYDLLNWDVEPRRYSDVLSIGFARLFGKFLAQVEKVRTSDPMTQRRRHLNPSTARMPLPSEHGLARGDRLSGRFFLQTLP